MSTLQGASWMYPTHSGKQVVHGGQNLIRPVGRVFCLLWSMCTSLPFMGSVSLLYNEAAQSLGPISASASGLQWQLPASGIWEEDGVVS